MLITCTDPKSPNPCNNTVLDWLHECARMHNSNLKSSVIFQHSFVLHMRLSKQNVRVCTFILVKPQGQWTIVWKWELHIYDCITSCILNKVMKMEKVEKGLGRTRETLLAFFKTAALQQQKCSICKEVNYRWVKVEIIPSVIFLHGATESQKLKHPVGTCKLETFLVVPKFPWALLLFVDNLPVRDLKCLGF